MGGRSRGLAIVVGAALSVWVATACSATSLPETRPPDLMVNVIISGGMIPEGSQTSISAGGGSFIDYNEGTRALTTFPVSAAELDGLYQVIRSNNFDLVEYEPSHLHDAPSVGVQVGYSDVWISVIEGPDHVLPDWEAEWQAVFDAAQAIVAAHINESGAVTVAYDDSLGASEIMLVVGGQGWSRNNTMSNPDSWRSAPGTITVRGMAWVGDQVLEIDQTLDFAGDTTLTAGLEGGAIVLTAAPTAPP